MTLVPVAAILVASMRLRFLDVLLHMRYRGPNVIPCDVGLRRGKRWVGSSMARPSRVRAARRSVEASKCARAAAFEWVRPLMRIDQIGPNR